MLWPWQSVHSSWWENRLGPSNSGQREYACCPNSCFGKFKIKMHSGCSLRPLFWGWFREDGYYGQSLQQDFTNLYQINKKYKYTLRLLKHFSQIQHDCTRLNLIISQLEISNSIEIDNKTNQLINPWYGTINKSFKLLIASKDGKRKERHKLHKLNCVSQIYTQKN